MEELFPAEALGATASQSVDALIEQIKGHEHACAHPWQAQQGGMVALREGMRSLGRAALDFALPARCAGCGTITDLPHQFCPQCWQQVEWLGKGGCEQCGLPLEATDIDSCGRCLARPPIVARSRAAVAYGDIARSLVMRLKYSRKVALADTMARYMRPLIDAEPGTILVPVPLHWSRMWWRGFNQSGLVAGHLSRLSGLAHRPRMLRRVRKTRALKNMNARQRAMEVKSAFAVDPDGDVKGRRFVLVDDVLTTGSTSDACAKALLRAGAERVDLICFARVVRPSLLER